MLGDPFCPPPTSVVSRARFQGLQQSEVVLLVLGHGQVGPHLLAVAPALVVGVAQLAPAVVFAPVQGEAQVEQDLVRGAPRLRGRLHPPVDGLGAVVVGPGWSRTHQLASSAGRGRRGRRRRRTERRGTPRRTWSDSCGGQGGEGCCFCFCSCC